jgi:hypothetical protein
MIRDAGQHVPQITFGIDSVQFSRTDQAVKGRGAFSTTIGARKKKILATKSHDPQRSFCYILVLLHYCRFRFRRHHRSASALSTAPVRNEGIRFSREFSQRLLEPLLQRLQQGPAARVANLTPLVGWTSADFLLDGIQPGDAFQGLSRNGGLVRNL